MTTDKYAKEAENRNEHNVIMGALMEIKDTLGDVKADSAYTRGKVDTMESSNKNLWSMMVAFGALMVAWFKGA